jgi:hypothetical protein
MQGLDPILRNDPPNWDDQADWSRYASAGKEPSPEELAQYLVGMACSGGDQTANIAGGLATRANVCNRYCNDAGHRYVKPLAEALLKANCKGEKTMTEETRAILQSLVAATD